MTDVTPTTGTGVQRTKTALILPEGMAYEDWYDLGQQLQTAAVAWSWWLGDWVNYGERRYGEGYAQAIDLTGLEYQTIANSRYVAEKVEFSRRRENLSWGHHAEVAGKEPAQQDEWLGRATAEGWSRNELRHALKQERLRDRHAVVPTGTGEFDVIYADPPWEYDYAESDSREIENQYPTMTLDEIKAYPVPAAEHSLLFLWATSPKLQESLEVVDAWGFEYRTCMVWVKDKIGMGYYARQQHELLLIAKRGEPPIPLPKDRPSSVVESPRAEHSAKPAEFYALIEHMWSNARRAELFARRARDGWEAYGNEV